MANYKTGAQRYNDRMNKIFERSRASGHNSLHPETKGQIEKNKGEYEKKHNMAKKMSKAK
jgi:hypothetical protein